MLVRAGTARRMSHGGAALYRALTLSSSVSASCSWMNSRAKPSSRFRTTRDWTLPSKTSDFSGGRFSAAMAAPDSDMSITRQVILVPSSSVMSAIGLRGMMRSWRRSSGRLRISRLASQVSWAASLSRLRAVAPTVMAKPLSIMRVILPSTRPIWSRCDDAIADTADAGRQQGEPPRRHIDDLAWKFAAVRQHIAAEQMNPHPLETAALFGGRKYRSFVRQRHLRHPTTGCSVAPDPTAE